MSLRKTHCLSPKLKTPPLSTIGYVWSSRNSHFVPMKVEGPGQKYEFVPGRVLVPDSHTCIRTSQPSRLWLIFWEVWHKWLHLSVDSILPLSPNCLSPSSLKVFPIGHFDPSLWVLAFSLSVPRCRGSNKQVRWQSVPTRPFWPNLSNKEV
jgi:hypothetical protein